MTSVAGAAGAEAAVLDWVRIDDDTDSRMSEYFRIKILTEEGKKHGDVELTYAPGYPVWGRIGSITARTIRPDGTIVPFDGKIYDKVVMKAGRSALRAKTFSLADVQPGSIIEYRYELTWSNQLIFNTHWSVQRDIPVVHASFMLKPYTEGDFGSMFTFAGLPPGKSPKRTGEGRYELELENMPALRSERFAPPEEQLRARVNFFYLSSSIKPETFWQTQTKTFAKEIEKFIGNSKSAAEVAKRLSAANADRTALLQAVYAHVQALRNLSFEPVKTEQEMKRDDVSESRNVEEVLRRGSGFSHELNRAFVGIARAAGFEADAVRVAPRDQFFFSDKLPDAQLMSGEIAVVTTDGKPQYFDAGTPMMPFGVVSWEKTSVAAIHVSKGAKAEWKTSPAVDAARAVTRREADLRINGDVLEGTVTATFRGQEAAVRRLRTVTEDEAARKKALEDEVKGWFPDGATLTLKSLAGDATFDDALVVSYDVIVPNVVSQAGSRTVVPISVFRTTAKNPFAPATRTHAIYFEYPSTEEDVVRLTVPEGMNVATLPPPSSLNGGAVGYRAETVRNGNEITYKRASNVSVMFVAPEHYTPLRNFYNMVAAADAQPLVLTPAATGGAK